MSNRIEEGWHHQSAEGGLFGHQKDDEAVVVVVGQAISFRPAEEEAIDLQLHGRVSDFYEVAYHFIASHIAGVV